MKLSFKKIVATGFAAVLAISSVNCGSSATTTEETAGTTEDNATAIAESTVDLAVQSASLVNPSISAALSKTPVTQSIYETFAGSIDCDSGTLDYSYDDVSGDFTFTANSCDFGSGSMDGSYSLSTSGDTTTLTFDNFTVDVDGTSFTMDGSMTLEVTGTDVSITYSSFSASDGTNDFSIDGTLTYTSSGLLTGDITVTDGTTSISCSFTDFDPATASDSEWATACEVL